MSFPLGAIGIAIVFGTGIIWWGDRFDRFRRTTIILFGIMGGIGLVAAGLVVNHGAFGAGDSLSQTALVVAASLVFAAGFGVLAATQGTGSSDTFHQIGIGIGIGNGVIAALYAILLYRMRTALA